MRLLIRIRLFPRSTPYVRLSPYTAFHRDWSVPSPDLCPLLRISLQDTSTLRTLLFSTGSPAYYSSSSYYYRPIPFLFPIILSVHQYLGHCFSKRSLDRAYNTLRTFSECKQYSSAISSCFHSQFRQPIRHSNHILFIDPRHVSMPPLVGFPHIAHVSISMHATVSGYSFQDVTPSFRISDYQFAADFAAQFVLV